MLAVKSNIQTFYQHFSTLVFSMQFPGQKIIYPKMPLRLENRKLYSYGCFVVYVTQALVKHTCLWVITADSMARFACCGNHKLLCVRLDSTIIYCVHNLLAYLVVCLVQLETNFSIRHWPESSIQG